MSDTPSSEDREQLRMRPGTLVWLQSITEASGILVALAGGSALAGWLLDIEVLRSVIPGQVAMNPATAAGLLLAGASLWLLGAEQRDPRSRQLGRLLGGLAAVLGLLKLAAHFSGLDLGDDQVFFQDRLDDMGLYLDGAAPNTAVSLLLSGLALVWIDTGTRRGVRPAQLLMLTVALIALLALVGHAYRLLSLQSVGPDILMALNNALAFSLLSLGVLLARPRRGLMEIMTSSSAGGVTARRLLPAALLIPLVLSGLMLWGEKARLYEMTFGMSLFAVLTVVIFSLLILWDSRSLYRADLARQQAERRLAVQNTVARVLAESPTISEAIPKILRAICEALGWPLGGMWEVDARSRSLNCVEVWHSPAAHLTEFETISRQATFPSGIGLPGRVWASGQPVWIPDVVRDSNFPRAPIAARVGLHGAFGLPIRRGAEVLGVMEFFSNQIQQPEEDLLRMLAAVGSQIGQFIERNRMEAALRDSEALYHSLVDTLPINILRKDMEGRVTFGNKMYCDNMGRALSEIVGKTDFDFFPRELAEKYVSDDHKVIETGKVFEDIEQHQKPDGEKLYVHVLKAPVFDARGKLVGTQTIFWDVTARRRAEEALERTAADLARSNKELELFAYVASHDLQEPLRMIASYNQLLARRYKDKLDADAEEFIGYAVDGALRMQRLIHDLLAYSRVGTIGKAFETTDCEKVFSAVMANLKIAVEESGAVVQHDPLPTLQADDVQLTQLLQNLIGNAIKFRGQNPPQIHVGAERKNDEWIFHVRDNGIGIDPQHFERIFVIFQRLHSRQEYPGTGIGLAVCKKIVERHGGRIWVESRPGHGASFFFTIPVTSKS